MKTLESACKERLQHYEQLQLRRTRQAIDSPQDATVLCEGETLLSFNSNDYLGLANHPQLIKALQEGAAIYGVGSGASALLGGYSRAHQVLEETLAEFCGYERALVFSSGQLANMAVIATLVQRQDRVLHDYQNHASLIDATLLSRARLKRYHHLNLAHLQKSLTELSNTQPWIVTESVFSMTGERAPLQHIHTLADTYHATLLVDDAHGFGYIGPQGRGSVMAAQLNQQAVPVWTGTLSKACGVSGAFVVGSGACIETLIQQGRQYIYTTAMSPAIAHAATASIQLIKRADPLRETLTENIKYFQRCATQLTLPLMPSSTAIQIINLQDNDRALYVEQHLRQCGLWVRAIRPPTVPENTARLRISLTAKHTHQDIDRLLEVLATCLV